MNPERSPENSGTGDPPIQPSGEEVPMTTLSLKDRRIDTLELELSKTQTELARADQEAAELKSRLLSLGRTYGRMTVGVAEDGPRRNIVSHKLGDLNNKLSIAVLDVPGPGGANHRYAILEEEGEILAVINFQKGAVKDVGEINGVSD